MEKLMLKPPAEIYYEEELLALKENDAGEKPHNWQLSPKSVRTFLLGSDKPLKYNNKKVYIKKKFYGDDLLIERCIITLAGNRGLILVGEPGTAKTMLSELLSAAICGKSTNTIQGTAGTTEDMIKYSWNYAMLISNGASKEALIPAPLYTAMEQGNIVRFEEITRCPSEVQDAMISVLSDKVLHIPELEEGILFAEAGFNIIATANTRDKGINEMSSALKRRFNFETVFPIKNISLEIEIISQEANKILNNSAVNMPIDIDTVEILATTFSELREGISTSGEKIDKPSAVMSTAEAVSVYCQSAMTAYYYDNKKINMDRLVQNILGTIIKENREDVPKLRNYFNVIVKKRVDSKKWKDFYEAKRYIR